MGVVVDSDEVHDVRDDFLERVGVTRAEWGVISALSTFDVRGVALDDRIVLIRSFNEQKTGLYNEESQKKIVLDVLKDLCKTKIELSAVDALLDGKAWRFTDELNDLEARIAYIVSEIPDQE